MSSPDPDLEVETDLTFQEYCGRILSNIIEQSISEGTLLAQDKDTGEVGAKPETLEWLKDEYQPRTDDT